MDFGTVDKKPTPSNPAEKPELAAIPRAKELCVIEFFSDLKLVFDNCYLFNRPDHIVLQCVKKLEAIVERLSKNMPLHK